VGWIHLAQAREQWCRASTVMNLLGPSVSGWATTSFSVKTGIRKSLVLLDISDPHGSDYEDDYVWYMTQCSLVNVNQRFTGAYCLHLQGQTKQAAECCA
jgi:hypothetical protein